MVGPAPVAARLAWFVAEWDNPGVGSSLVFSIGLALQTAALPLVAFTSARPSRLMRAQYDGPFRRRAATIASTVERHPKRLREKQILLLTSRAGKCSLTR
jgi:hypothetical protein